LDAHLIVADLTFHAAVERTYREQIAIESIAMTIKQRLADRSTVDIGATADSNVPFNARRDMSAARTNGIAIDLTCMSARLALR